ncbi:hypothetical protein BT93_H3427 [Corymbia citriodora subsp. variegata]|nr:hypothetical protein BT93_H3427 [Corymbia citriodora subsp. variegata]
MQKKGDCTGENDKTYKVLHAVNLRPRMDPLLSDRHFGNISRIALAMPTRDTDEHMIVNQVREAIKEVNTDYAKKLREGEGHLNFMKECSARILKGEVVPFSFTSLCQFPTYEADSWWGQARVGRVLCASLPEPCCLLGHQRQRRHRSVC